MVHRLLIVFLFTFSLSAAEINIYSGESIIEVDPNIDCNSKLFKFNGEDYVCVTVDRLGILKSHRNLNLNAYNACLADVTYLKNLAIVVEINRDATRKCNELGKIFDPIEVTCTGSMPKEN